MQTEPNQLKPIGNYVKLLRTLIRIQITTDFTVKQKIGQLVCV